MPSTPPPIVQERLTAASLTDSQRRRATALVLVHHMWPKASHGQARLLAAWITGESAAGAQ